MSKDIASILDAVFDSSLPSDGVSYMMLPTPIGPVLFGSDGSMRYGDNFMEDVPLELRETAKSARDNFNQ